MDKALYFIGGMIAGYGVAYLVGRSRTNTLYLPGGVSVSGLPNPYQPTKSLVPPSSPYVVSAPGINPYAGNNPYALY